MDNLGNRMKQYERVSKNFLLSKTPVILRVDGKAFHTFTKDFQRPFDYSLIRAMLEAGKEVAKNAMGFVFGYHQSDEFSFYLTNTQNLNSEMWFGGEVQKLCSVTASIFTARFSSLLGTNAYFDCRAFNVPENDAPNYFVWRQKDWIRNSIQMLASSQFSHISLQGKNRESMKKMLLENGTDWESLPPKLKYGTFLTSDLEEISEEDTYAGLCFLMNLDG